MRSSDLLPPCKMLALVLTFCALGVVPASAQTDGGEPAGQTGQSAQTTQSGQPRRQPQGPRVVFPVERAPAPVARDSEAACGGFIEQAVPAAQFEIVGAETERERRVFAEGHLVFINAGAQQGARAGQEFSIVRPRGQFRSKFTRKRGSLGVYTQEVGRLRVVSVRDYISVAEIVRSCDTVLLGDLLRPVPQRNVPAVRAETNLDRFAQPSGKQTGRIVLARDGREVLSRDQVVFIDLGAEDNVRVGDYLTVYRPEGHGTFVQYGDELADNHRDGFESEELRGGGFSNQAQRLKDVDGDKSGSTVKTPAIKKRRPSVPRRVVGELVVIRTEGRTSVAVVTRVVQEVHTGDAVEVQ